MTYMDEDGETHSDLRLPSACEADIALAEDLKNKFADVTDGDIFITVLSAMGVDSIKAYRVVKQ